MTKDAPIAFAEDQDATRVSDPVDTLRQAMRRARQDNAERAAVVADLRTARLGRLELLAEALKPLVAQIPADVDTFDVGLMPGANPRLFIDMIGFIEMGRDARVYRLLQDTRHGRTVLSESESVDTTVDAVTDYVARRLLERDKALAADARHRPHQGDLALRDQGASGEAPPSRRSARHPIWTGIASVFNFLVDFFGWLTLLAILLAAGWYAWQRAHGSV